MDTQLRRRRRNLVERAFGPDERAAHIRQARRAGLLSDNRLELGAALADPACCAELGVELPHLAFRSNPYDWQENWVAELEQFNVRSYRHPERRLGGHAAARAASAVAEWASRQLEPLLEIGARRVRATIRGYRAGVRAADRCVLGQGSLGSLRAAGQLGRRRYLRFGREEGAWCGRVLQTYRYAVEFMLNKKQPWRRRCEVLSHVVHAGWHALAGRPSAELLEAIQAEVLPWLLGECDPLAERVSTAREQLEVGARRKKIEVTPNAARQTTDQELRGNPRGSNKLP